MKTLVKDIAKLMNVKPKIKLLPPREGDVTYLCGDGSKAKDLLNFVPSTPWEEGLKKCIDYYSNI